MQNSNSPTGTFSENERAAIVARAAEIRATQGLKGQAKRERQAEESARLISEMPEPDRAIALAVDTVIAEVAPQLAPRTWYGMPAYSQDDKVLCFFQAATKFDTRYATFGFNDTAHLDDGAMWPTSFAIKEMTSDVADRIRNLVLRATSTPE